MNGIEKVFKNSESELAVGQRAILTYENALLMPCTLEQRPDEFVLNFQTEGYCGLGDIKKTEKVDKYRFLANCARLETLAKEYVFSLAPENLMCNYNLEPRVLERDVSVEKRMDFLSEYKALIGTILYPRYRFADFLEGGKDLFRKRSVLRDVAAKESVSELYQMMTDAYERDNVRIHTKKKLVSRKNAFAVRVAIPLMLLALCTLGALCYMAYERELPLKESMLQADNAYIAGNYIGATEALEGYAVNVLPLTSRYVLANSYVRVEGLTDEQKKSVLSSLTLQAEETVINYWIYTGRGDYEKAIDNAKLLGDDELLLFALIKQSVAVQNSTNITGEEKAAQSAKLQEQIEKLQEEMAKAKAEVEATAGAGTENVGESVDTVPAGEGGTDGAGEVPDMPPAAQS